ncbi:MAG TPA: hypothetical protein VEH57_04945 [Thermoplasmata archaeon]|nr:hypothetical protein [Thermoplasmata archaeon]
MDAASYGTAASLILLCLLLSVLCARGVYRFLKEHARQELPWAGGLGLAAGAMAIEVVVYFGTVTIPIMDAYVFLSAAIVGILSLGATHVFHRPRVERAYCGYVLAGCTLVAVLSFVTPLPGGMVTNGVITGNPSLLLLVMSSLVTFPATVVLLAAAAVALRRSRKWQTLLMIAGALILGAGGTLYIASFPVALYYAEFVGIILLFFGLVSLPHPSKTAATVSAPMVAS